MIEKNEPLKSIFNLGQTRHNLMINDENGYVANNNRQVSIDPVRIIEWKENVKNQKYDKKIASKIGEIKEDIQK